RRVMRGAPARLTARQRTVLVLRYFEDLPEAEVARILGCSAGTPYGPPSIAPWPGCVPSRPGWPPWARPPRNSGRPVTTRPWRCASERRRTRARRAVRPGRGEAAAAPGFADRVLAVRRRHRTRRLASAAAAAVVAVAVAMPMLDSGKQDVRPSGGGEQTGFTARPDQSPPRDLIATGRVTLAAYCTSRNAEQSADRAASERTYWMLNPEMKKDEEVREGRPVVVRHHRPRAGGRRRPGTGPARPAHQAALPRER
ncbi:putative uncharacterized protein, partial [Streptomyces azureus]